MSNSGFLWETYGMDASDSRHWRKKWNSLNQGNMPTVCRGARQHAGGWTGAYV